MKVFVTGADGFIGSHLCERLIADGHEVTGLALYNSERDIGWMREVEGVTAVHGDIRDAECIARLIDGHEVVYHLAALIDVPYSSQAPRSYIDTNVIGTLNVLEAVRLVGAKLVHTSSSEVYGTAKYRPQDEKHPKNPQSPYAASKVAADALVASYIESFGIEAVTLRPFNTYGPRQSTRAIIAHVAREIAVGAEIIKVGSFVPERDWTYVTDTVRAFTMVPIAGGEFNAGSGQTISVGDMIRKMCAMRTVTAPVAFDSGRLRPNEVGALIAGTRKLTQATGWKPEVSLEEGLRRTLEWWDDRIKRTESR